MILISKLESKLGEISEKPGVYIFYNQEKKPVYIGKAKNLRQRIASYLRAKGKSSAILAASCFLKTTPTDSELESFLLEADLIKIFWPKFNVRQKDDRSFLYLIIRHSDYPYLEVVREKKIDLNTKDKIFGPFVDSNSLKEVLKALRGVFPFRDCSSSQFEKAKKAKHSCLYYHLGKCPAPCLGKITKTDYQIIINDLILFLEGKKTRLFNKWEKQMREAALRQQFEKAKAFRDKLKACERLSRLRFISNSQLGASRSFKIEAFDIAQIFGESKVGAMVVYKAGLDENNILNGQFLKAGFRRFKLEKSKDDIGLLKQMLRRRFKHQEWCFPDLILVDGGENHLYAAKSVLADFDLDLPVVALAKDRHHKVKKPVLPPDRFKWPYLVDLVRKNWSLLIEINERAHRFAQKYFHLLRSKKIKGKK